MKKIVLTIILSHVLYSSVFSQSIDENFKKLSTEFDTISQSFTEELIYLQTSKGIYETGEDLWHKAYMLNAQYLVPISQSRTLYLQLLKKENKQVVWQEKYEIVNGFTNGHLNLNDTLLEGNYLLAAFTGKSVFRNDTEIKALREIEIRRDLKPKVTITTHFVRPSYGTGDSVAVNVTTINEQQKPQFAQIVASLFKDGLELEKLEAETSPTDGTACFRFNPVYTSKGLTLKIEAKYSKSTEHIQLTVPFHVGCPIQFGLFPEGGNLVHGLESKVAFKAVNSNGNPEKVEGILYENNKELLKFNSVHDGMGSFSLIPDAGKNYTVKITAPETDSLFALPEIKLRGVSFQLHKRDSSLLWFKVQQSPDLPKNRIYLRGQSRGVVYCMASGIFRNNELDIKIPLTQFPIQGIVEFTLFNNELRPIAERLVYVNPENRLYIETKVSKEKYSTREKVKIDLKVTDKSGQPVIANLGISVFDNIYRNNYDGKNILTHCHLFTQLKGNIYNPAFYFDEKNDGRFEALDLLLITQGWRKYVWSETKLKNWENEKQPFLEDGVTGKLIATKKQTKAPIGGQYVMVHNPGENKGMDLLETAPDGSFSISPVHLKNWQGGYVYLKPMGDEEFGYKLVLSNPFDSINALIGHTKLLYPQYKPAVEELPKVRAFVPGPDVIELDEVTVKGKTKVQFRDKYLGQLDSLAKLDMTTDYVGVPCETLNCPQHDKDRSKKPVEGEDYYYMTGFKWNDSRSAYTITGSGYITYHYPAISEEELLKMNNLSRVKAYYREREFYQPNYDKQEELHNRIPDFRNTLAWEPMILTNEKGEACLEFFCSDLYTGFIGIIEGVDGNGQLGFQNFEFNVRKTKKFDWE